MSVFAMLLAAGMAIGDGAKHEAEDIAILRLDTRGKWEGTFLNAGGIKWKCVVENGEIRGYDRGKLIAVHDWKVVDEGNGKLRLTGCPNKTARGIYKVEGDSVTICFSDMPNPRPQTFQVNKLQAMYVLHRAKPGK